CPGCNVGRCSDRRNRATQEYGSDGEWWASAVRSSPRAPRGLPRRRCLPGAPGVRRRAPETAPHCLPLGRVSGLAVLPPVAAPPPVAPLASRGDHTCYPQEGHSVPDFELPLCRNYSPICKTLRALC